MAAMSMVVCVFMICVSLSTFSNVATQDEETYSKHIVHNGCAFPDVYFTQSNYFDVCKSTTDNHVIYLCSGLYTLVDYVCKRNVTYQKFVSGKLFQKSKSTGDPAFCDVLKSHMNLTNVKEFFNVSCETTCGGAAGKLCKFNFYTIQILQESTKMDSNNTTGANNENTNKTSTESIPMATTDTNPKTTNETTTTTAAKDTNNSDTKTTNETTITTDTKATNDTDTKTTNETANTTTTTAPKATNDTDTKATNDTDTKATNETTKASPKATNETAKTNTEITIETATTKVPKTITKAPTIEVVQQNAKAPTIEVVQQNAGTLNGGQEGVGKFSKPYDVPSSGNFMAYFLTAVVLCIAGYVVFHNKQKIIAFIIEGRSTRSRRRPNGSGDYKKLQSNVEECSNLLSPHPSA